MNLILNITMFSAPLCNELRPLICHVARLVEFGLAFVFRMLATICAAARPRGVIAGIGDGNELKLRAQQQQRQPTGFHDAGSDIHRQRTLPARPKLAVIRLITALRAYGRIISASQSTSSDNCAGKNDAAHPAA
jgi:hypothetical protein